MGNAIRFTSEGQVWVRARREGSRVYFEVQDSGVGISPSALQEIFKPFVQAKASTMRTFGGTGLGLAIARHLVECMGGTLTASSEEGKGSTFRFDIALPACEPPREILTDSLNVEELDPRLSVLVAEDNRVNREVIGRQLEVLELRATVVEDGEQALSCMTEKLYDVVLMDLHMPKPDGLGATRAARKLGYQGPIIAMTASALKEDQAAARDAGMTAFLEKPVTLKALRRALAESDGEASRT